MKLDLIFPSAQKRPKTFFKKKNQQTH